MDIEDYMQAAGRAVLELVEREWEPLSQVELEQRLDQAVEDILEADLFANVRSQPPTFYLTVVQAQQSPEPPAAIVQAHQSPEPPAVIVQAHQSPEPPAAIVQAHQSPEPPAAIVQVHQSPESPAAAAGQTPCPPQPAVEEAQSLDEVDNEAVKHITDLLQRSTAHSSSARLAGRARLSLHHTVLLSLTLLSRRISYRSVSTRLRLEKGNIHRIFFSFCERVNMLQKELITWPTGQEAVELLCPLSTPEGRGLPTVLGVLGHTRIPIRLPIGKQDGNSAAPDVRRVTKQAHPDSWLHLELVCDRHGRLRHCRTAQGSDADRAGALAQELRRCPELLPPGACLVAAAGYPLTAKILTPYAGRRGPREALYNRALKGHLGTLCRTVSSLTSRFGRLQHLDVGSYERARALVLTACVLHNALLDTGQGVGRDEEEKEVVVPVADPEPERETDTEGIRRREVVSDLLYRHTETGSAV